MSSVLDRSQLLTVIEPSRRSLLEDLPELARYRDLYVFLVLRGIKVRYAQSVIGVGWAVIQPVFSMLVFTVVFGRFAQIDSDGVPYALFSFAALVPWTYFSNALTDSTSSLVANSQIISKVYFPRVILPLAAVTAKLVDFMIAMVVLLLLMLSFGQLPTPSLVVLPLLVLLMMLSAFGLGTWLTALAIQYRDVQHASTFLVQLLMYAAPVVYPVSMIPSQYRLLYALNPMVGVIEGFRAAMLGTQALPWTYLGMGALTASLMAVTGMLYFRSREHLFADVA